MAQLSLNEIFVIFEWLNGMAQSNIEQKNTPTFRGEAAGERGQSFSFNITEVI